MSDKNTDESWLKTWAEEFYWARDWACLRASPARLFYTVTPGVERS